MAFSAPLVCKDSVSSPTAPINRCAGKRTYAELHGGGEEVNTGSLGDLIAAGNTGQVDESRLDDSLLALGGLDHGLGESIVELVTERAVDMGRTGPESGICHGQSSRSSTILGLDDLVTTKLDACVVSVSMVSSDDVYKS